MVLWELKFGFLIKMFMLRPKKVKYNKARKIRIKRMEYRQNNVVFGSYGLKTLDEPVEIVDQEWNDWLKENQHLLKHMGLRKIHT